VKASRATGQVFKAFSYDVIAHREYPTKGIGKLLMKTI
jgi:hypothetical protein